MEQKRHNWMTNVVDVDEKIDEETDRAARDFIASCNLYTQASEAELFGTVIGMGTTETTSKPSCEYLQAEAESWDDDDNAVPDKTAYEKR